MKKAIEFEIRNYRQRLANLENVTMEEETREALHTKYKNGLELQEGLLKKYTDREGKELE